VLARRGYGSRRVCEELIAAGRVEVNGQVATLGARVMVGDEVRVDGAPVGLEEGLAYYLVNKPVGVISTARDEQGRPSVVAMVPSEVRLYPVGRLDAASEGLLLLTNDGPLAHYLTHPSSEVEKEYLLELDRPIPRGVPARFRRGIDDGGERLVARRVGVLGPSTLRVVLTEGRNRELRRMCTAVGLGVRRLVRVRLGPIADPTLAPGTYRELTAEEVIALRRAGRRLD
jgi:23S rRNA pseudouridine2605 synthase